MKMLGMFLFKDKLSENIESIRDDRDFSREYVDEVNSVVHDIVRKLIDGIDIDRIAL